MIKTLVASSRSRYDNNYVYALLMDQEFGVMNNLMPNVMDRCLSLLKAKTKDPDLPNIRKALTGPYREEFLKAMCTEIEEIKKHNTWTVIKRSQLPDGTNVLPSMWVLRIK